MVTRRARTRGRAPQLCKLLFVAAMVLTAVIALAVPAGMNLGIPGTGRGRRGKSVAAEEHATEKESEVEEQQLLQRRDFVTVRDIELVGTAAGRAAVSHVRRRENNATGSPQVKHTWPPWPPRPPRSAEMLPARA